MSSRETIESPTDSGGPTAPLARRGNTPALGKFTPVLICIDGPQRSQRFPVDKPEIIIGRSSRCDIVLDDDMTSRRHARITFRDSGTEGKPPECTIEDLGSRNGTELNGNIINLPSVLRERDRILVGCTVLGFFLRDEGEMRLENFLYEMAAYDALTGLYNRHQFSMLMSHHIERSRRYERPLCLLVIDADNFKVINDTRGHNTGDLALIHLASLISSCCRATEFCARWGGDEFVILMPDSDAQSALRLAERICQTVGENPLKTTQETVGMTVSIGTSELNATDTADMLFQKADRRLLAAKSSGPGTILQDDTGSGLASKIPQPPGTV
ncbi:MAG: GGDEF domain-containing protein [Candidatus Sumerlaeaceae bacterium]|nr:GGDEF domain-containing protein [Candidatus Sumerlaeaceae bacterium]